MWHACRVAVANAAPIRAGDLIVDRYLIAFGWWERRVEWETDRTENVRRNNNM